MANKIEHRPIDYSDFMKILNFYGLKDRDDFDLMYEIYEHIIMTANIHQKTFSALPSAPLEHPRLILFLINDYMYRFANMRKEEIIAALDDELFYAKVINVIIDKYGGESYFKYDQGSFLNRYSMEISTLNVYINFILLKLRQLQENSGPDKLYLDLLKSAFSLCQTIIELLVHGFERDALSSWRSLHELEAALVLLEDQKLIGHYQQHIIYNAAFNKLLAKEEADEVFVLLKKDLKDRGLKSKDMRRFIEYGWISYHEDFDPNIHKFNFRDGVETLAKLTDSRETYQVASEVAHSSPIMLFTNRRYFLKLTLIHLYRSFILIENLFANNYISRSDPMEKELYLAIRKFYLEDINFVYNQTLEI